MFDKDNSGTISADEIKLVLSQSKGLSESAVLEIIK